MKNIKTTQKKLTAEGIKLIIKENKKEVGRASLYFLKNDLHKKPSLSKGAVFWWKNCGSVGLTQGCGSR